MEGGGIQDAVVIEALIRVRQHKLWEQYSPPKKDHVAVYRTKNVPPGDIEIIVAEAVEHVGKLENGTQYSIAARVTVIRPLFLNPTSKISPFAEVRWPLFLNLRQHPANSTNCVTE